MAAHEDHAQLIVSKPLLDVGVGGRRRRGARQLGDELIGLVAERAVAAHGVDRDVVRDAKEPSRRVVGHALIRPGLQRADHRFLDGVFGKADARGAEKARQAGHHAARLMAEQMLDERCGAIPITIHVAA